MTGKRATEGRVKKPYVKPELGSATVYEASGATCCKVTNQTCSISGRSTLGKTQRLSTIS
jgi:hypothetical protein